MSFLSDISLEMIVFVLIGCVCEWTLYYTGFTVFTEEFKEFLFYYSFIVGMFIPIIVDVYIKENYISNT